MCQLSLYLLHFSHISRNIKMVVKSTLLLDVALLVSTYLYFLEGKGVVPVYHKLFTTILLTHCIKTLKNHSRVSLFSP